MLQPQDNQVAIRSGLLEIIGTLSEMSSVGSTGRTNSVAATRIGGGAGGGAKAAIGGLAADIAGTIAGELNMGVDPDGRRKPGSVADPYAVDETAQTLVSELGGNLADRGRVAQSLHSLAQEIASLIVARPDSRTLEQVSAAIDAAAGADTGPPSVASVLAVIDRTTAIIAGKAS